MPYLNSRLSYEGLRLDRSTTLYRLQIARAARFVAHTYTPPSSSEQHQQQQQKKKEKKCHGENQNKDMSALPASVAPPYPPSSPPTFVFSTIY